MLVGSAQAAILKYEFAGTITTITESSSISSVSIGDSWTAVFYVDMNATDSNPHIYTGTYGLAVGVASQIGGLPEFTTNIGEVWSPELIVAEDSNPCAGFGSYCGPVDFATWRYSDYPSDGTNNIGTIDGYKIVSTRVTLTDDDGVAFSGEDIAQTQVLNLTDFEDKDFVVSLDDPDILGGPTIYGEVTSASVSVIPIPAAVWLFASGLGLLGWFRRKYW